MREVLLRNLTKSTVLGNRVAVADSFVARFLGLMGRTSLKEGGGLLLSPSSGVHTFWMRIPIDIIGMDKDRSVVCLAHAVRPWRICCASPRVSSIVELPAGRIAATHTAIGDTLLVEDQRWS